MMWNDGRPFVVSKSGAEAGESLDAILKRKQGEAKQTGCFFWGIGSSIGARIRRVVDAGYEPSLEFVSILGKPRQIDHSPSKVQVWTHYADWNGAEYPLPSKILITSRAPSTKKPSPHFALVCSNMQISPEGKPLFVSALRNWDGAPGKKLGASQVTAVVCDIGERSGPAYTCIARALLVAPWFVRLTKGYEMDVTELGLRQGARRDMFE